MWGRILVYAMSPSRRHTAVSTARPDSPGVLLRGDRVVNTASLAFLGSGRLQMVPSQQDVQILYSSCFTYVHPVDRQSSRGTQRLVTDTLSPVTLIMCWLKQYLVPLGQ